MSESSRRFPMKVAHLTSVHSPFDERIFLKECRSLARAGYEVVLIAPHTHDETAEGVHIRAVPKRPSRFYRMTRVVNAVYSAAVNERASIYHFHDPELIGVGLLLAMRGYRVIYDAHEDCPADVLDKAYLPKRLRPAVSHVVDVTEQYCARRFSAIVAATTSIAKRFSAYNPNTVSIHNYPVTEEIDNGKTTSRRNCSVAYAGGITPDRGVREMIAAMPQVTRDCSATLEIAGPYSSPEFRSELMQMPGWQHVREWGFVSRQQVFALLHEAGAGCVLYQPVANSVAAEPNKLFEYMSASLPVIASDFPLWRQIVQDAGCGVVVNPGDVNAIAKATASLLRRPEEARTMGERGRRAVIDAFNWVSQERKLLELYSNLLKGRPQPDIVTEAGFQAAGESSIEEVP